MFYSISRTVKSLYCALILLLIVFAFFNKLNSEPISFEYFIVHLHLWKQVHQTHIFHQDRNTHMRIAILLSLDIALIKSNHCVFEQLSNTVLSSVKNTTFRARKELIVC